MEFIALSAEAPFECQEKGQKNEDLPKRFWEMTTGKIK